MDKCSSCGVCCKLFWINLSEEEYGSRKFKTMFGACGFVKNFSDAEIEAANILAKKDDGSCIYLKDNTCSIYDKRPISCRNFFCSSKDEKFVSMIEKIKKFKSKH